MNGLMTICHDARKGGYIGSHWPNHGAPLLYSTISDSSSFCVLRASCRAVWKHGRTWRGMRTDPRAIDISDSKPRVELSMV
jgi:hypothetical protein